MSESPCTAVPSPVNALVLGRGVKGFHGTEGPLHCHPLLNCTPHRHGKGSEGWSRPSASREPDSLAMLSQLTRNDTSRMN